MSPDSRTVEGIARVVRVADGTAWFEPEQTTSCGYCAASGACVGGGAGIGSVARRIELRRFPLADAGGLAVGERVVVGVGERALLKAALTAYALPLAAALVAGGLAQGLAGSDGLTLAAMLAGLGTGLLVARGAARRLAARGELAPRFLRRAAPGETCRTG